jgi:hypothetical protein
MAVPTTKVTFSVLARGLKPGETVHLSGDGPLGHFQAARAMPLTRAEAAKKPAAPSATSAATAVVWQTAKPIILARDVPLRYRQVRTQRDGLRRLHFQAYHVRPRRPGAGRIPVVGVHRSSTSTLSHPPSPPLACVAGMPCS